MANFPLPVKNTAYILYCGLVSQASTLVLQANPTLAAGDVKVSIDGGAFANLGTLPTVTPAAGKAVKVSLSSGEMNGDNIALVFSDAAGAEWCDLIIDIQTATRGIDDLAFPTVSGRSLDVSATGEAGLDWANVGSPTTTLNLSGTSTKAVEPTVAGRTLDVSVTGEAGLDWANIGSPTTVNNLSGTSTKAVEPTVAGRTLDISVGGEAGLDWANIGSPTTSVNLSGTSTKAVEPTVAGRTLDVSVGGEAGLDWANIGSPTTVQSLTNTTISVVTTTGTVTNPVTTTSCIKKNTALANFSITMTDSTTHAPKSGLVPAGQVSLDGGAYQALTNTPCTEVSNGDYKINLAAADMNANVVKLRFTAATADDLNLCILTQS